MLNIFDILNRYKTSLDTKLTAVDGIVGRVMDNIDDLSYIIDNTSTDLPNIPDIAIEMNVDEVTAVKRLAQAMVYSFSQITIFDDEGNVIPINVTRDPDWEWGSLDVGAQSPFRWEASVHAADIEMHDFSNTIKSPRDLMNKLLESSGVNYVISRALQLVQQGELTVANFMSSIPDYVNAANEQVKYCINAIRDAITSTSVYGQATALFNVIKNFIGDIGNATADDSDMKISFNDTDYSIRSAIFLPVNDVINLATTALGMIISIFKPIIGIAITAVGTMVAKVIDIINKNDDIHFELTSTESRDNDCFAPPIFQFEKVYWSGFPSILRSAIKDYGIVKATNGILTIYFWSVDDSHCNIEGYMNAKSDILYNTPQVSDGLKSRLTSLMDWNNSLIDDITLGSINDLSLREFITNVNVWLTDGLNPGGEAPYPNLVTAYGQEQIDNLCARRYIYMFMLLVYMYLCITEAQSGTNYGVSLEDYMIMHEKRGKDLTDLQTAIVIFTELQYHISQGYINNIWDEFGSLIRTDVKDVTNDGIPALRSLYSNLTLLQINDLINSFTWVESEFSDSITDLGESMPFILTYSVFNKANSYILPPENTVSSWVQFAFTSALIVAVSVTAIVIRAKIKRQIKIKAMQKKEEISALKEEAVTYEDFQEVYKKAKKYNRTWGFLSGCTYDATNDWIDYDPVVAAGDLSDGLLDKVKSVEDDAPTLRAYDATTDDTVRDEIDKIKKLITSF